MTVDNRKALVEAVDTWKLMDAIKVATEVETSEDPEITEIAQAIRSLIEENGTKLYDPMKGYEDQKKFDELTPSEVAYSLELSDIAIRTAFIVRLQLREPLNSDV